MRSALSMWICCLDTGEAVGEEVSPGLLAGGERPADAMPAPVAGRAEENQPLGRVIDQMPGHIQRAALGERPQVVNIEAGVRALAIGADSGGGEGGDDLPPVVLPSGR